MKKVANTSKALPTQEMTSQPLCQHHSSMYQQHTYMDHNHMAVTDVFFQEQVSQSTWGVTQTNPFVLNNRPTYLANVHLPTGYVSGTQIYTANAIAGAAYSQTYAAHSMLTTSGVYMPQTQYVDSLPAPVKQSRDAFTQVNLIKNLPALVKLKHNSSLAEDTAVHETTDVGTQTNSLDSGAGDGVNAPAVLPAQVRNSEIVLSQQRLHEIIRIALHGSEIAEKLASLNRSRPCFKRIDTICARLQQDLLRPSGVMANINSQGISWAVKDFIFAFTRIVSAWIIVKGYVYNTPDGLNKIKDELPTEFMTTFDNWQASTLCFLDTIIKSFIRLDGIVQYQKNYMVKLEPNGHMSNDFSSDSSSQGAAVPLTTANGPKGHSTPNNNSCSAVSTTAALSKNSVNMLNIASSAATETPKWDISLNYLYDIMEDSEETQRHVDATGTYLKTGTYAPLEKETKRLYLRPHIVPVPLEPHILPCAIAKKKDAAKPAWKWQSIRPTRTLEHEKLKPRPWPRPKNVRSYINPYSIVGREVARKIADFCDWILNLHSVEQFFQKDFIEAYFPDFYSRCQEDFYDVRCIILKCEYNIYDHVYEAIHDLRHISFVVHSYLKVYNNYRLRLHIQRFDQVVDEMLAKPPSLPNQYDHIRGRPGEKLFNYEI